MSRGAARAALPSTPFEEALAQRSNVGAGGTVAHITKYVRAEGFSPRHMGNFPMCA
jgi:hypothetical protein